MSVGLDLSSSHLRFLTARLREHRRAIGSRWRRLSAGRQALLALAHLRNGHPYAQLAAGFGIGTTTAYRYITEAVDLLAALAPPLEQAVHDASAKAFVLLGGTLLPIDRIAADRPSRSGSGRSGHKRMYSRFVALRVRPAGREIREATAGTALPVRRLLAEWPADQDEPVQFWLADLPETTPLPVLVRTAGAWMLREVASACPLSVPVSNGSSEPPRIGTVSFKDLGVLRAEPADAVLEHRLPVLSPAPSSPATVPATSAPSPAW